MRNNGGMILNSFSHCKDTYYTSMLCIYKRPLQNGNENAQLLLFFTIKNYPGHDYLGIGGVMRRIYRMALSAQTR